MANGTFTDDTTSERVASEVSGALKANGAEGSRLNGDDPARLKTKCPLC
jgi:hypothetical protein